MKERIKKKYAYIDIIKYATYNLQDQHQTKFIRATFFYIFL